MARRVGFGNVREEPRGVFGITREIGLRKGTPMIGTEEANREAELEAIANQPSAPPRTTARPSTAKTSSDFGVSRSRSRSSSNSGAGAIGTSTASSSYASSSSSKRKAASPWGAPAPKRAPSRSTSAASDEDRASIFGVLVRLVIFGVFSIAFLISVVASLIDEVNGEQLGADERLPIYIVTGVVALVWFSLLRGLFRAIASRF